MTPPRVRLGIVGCVNVLGAYAVLALRLQQEALAEVLVLCGREHQRSSAAKLFPAVQFVTEYNAVLSRREIDAVVILTPMSKHGPMAKAALQAGKHVLVEKPLAVNLSEANELVSLARSSSRLLMCAPFTLLSPTFQTLSRRVRRGDIGKVVSARGQYGWGQSHGTCRCAFGLKIKAERSGCATQCRCR